MLKDKIEKKIKFKKEYKKRLKSNRANLLHRDLIHEVDIIS
jgi:hypothetical protein